MTNNQINYQKNLEIQRSNVANERLKSSEIAELRRSNQAKEATNRYIAYETQRHNVAQEGLGYFQAKETARSNKAREIENTRSNKAKEAYTSSYYSGQVSVNQLMADYTREKNRIQEAYNVQSNYLKGIAQDEVQRANKASERLRTQELRTKESIAALDRDSNQYIAAMRVAGQLRATAMQGASRLATDFINYMK